MCGRRQQPAVAAQPRQVQQQQQPGDDYCRTLQQLQGPAVQGKWSAVSTLQQAVAPAHHQYSVLAKLRQLRHCRTALHQQQQQQQKLAMRNCVKRCCVACSSNKARSSRVHSSGGGASLVKNSSSSSSSSSSLCALTA
jgi:hypothetical protein